MMTLLAGLRARYGSMAGYGRAASVEDGVVDSRAAPRGAPRRRACRSSRWAWALGGTPLSSARLFWHRAAHAARPAGLRPRPFTKRPAVFKLSPLLVS